MVLRMYTLFWRCLQISPETIMWDFKVGRFRCFQRKCGKNVRKMFRRCASTNDLSRRLVHFYIWVSWTRLKSVEIVDTVFIGWVFFSQNKKKIFFKDKKTHFFWSIFTKKVRIMFKKCSLTKSSWGNFGSNTHQTHFIVNTKRSKSWKRFLYGVFF